jgi:ABC-2 type transport system permease protein
VNKGELDILLTKPISPLFMALTRYISISSIFNFAMGIGICITYAKGAGFPGGIHWLLVPVWLSVGVIAALLLRFIFSIWVFWTERGFALARLYYQFFTFATKPETLYPKTIRYIMLTILPFALIGSLPARALMQGLKLEEYIVLIAVLLGFYFLNRMLWRQGLKRYQSASS